MAALAPATVISIASTTMTRARVYALRLRSFTRCRTAIEPVPRARWEIGPPTTRATGCSANGTSSTDASRTRTAARPRTGTLVPLNPTAIPRTSRPTRGRH